MSGYEHFRIDLEDPSDVNLELRDIIDKFTSRASQWKDQVSGLETDVENLKEQIDTLKDQIEEKDEKIKELEAAAS